MILGLRGLERSAGRRMTSQRDNISLGIKWAELLNLTKETEDTNKHQERTQKEGRRKKTAGKSLISVLTFWIKGGWIQ